MSPEITEPYALWALAALMAAKQADQAAKALGELLATIKRSALPIAEECDEDRGV